MALVRRQIISTNSDQYRDEEFEPTLNETTIANQTNVRRNNQPGTGNIMMAKPRSSATKSRGSSISNGSRRDSLGDQRDSTTNASSSANYLQQPVCNRFGFIVDNEDSAGNMRNFLNDDLGDDKQSKEQAIAKMLKRERKWLEMIDNWDKWILSKRFEHTKKRCRKGIPSAVRGKAWFYLSGGHISLEKYSKFYEKLEREPGDEQVCDEIRKDIHRQFPNHELFREANGPGQQSLFNVLKCFSIVRKEISYCQGLAPVASILLMNMPPSHAFWSLVAITDHYVPGYYLPGFQAVQLHGRMLFGLLKKHAPVAYRILKKSDIDPVLYMFEWFMCLFVRNLPWATVLRIWDMFLCEGIVVIFKAAIVIVGTTLTNDHKKMDQHDILQLLKNVPESQLQESVFIPKVLKLNLTDKHLKREHSRQLRKKAKGK
uniref:TBC1 domain family member 10A n=1 Tax=Aceria tosichella TaxID=561515 RepID=A0A6G1SED3_9ACAR